MQTKLDPRSLLTQIRAAESLDEIGQLLNEGGGFGKAKDKSIKRWQTAAKKRAQQLRRKL